MKRHLKSALSLLLTICLAFMALPITVSAATPMVTAEFRNLSPAIMQNRTADIQLSMVGTPYTGTVVKNDVVLIIDRSGSMRYDIDAMKTAAKEFVSKVDMSQHRVGIVAFDTVVSSTPITTDVNTLNTFIDSLAVAGSTYMNEGIKEAVSLLSQKRSDATGSIVLMSDGVPYGTPTSEEDAEKEGIKAKNLGYMFYTVALTPSTNSEANKFLKKLATSETDHYFVGSSSLLSNVYTQIAQKIGQCNARDVVATATISPEFEYVVGSGDNSIPRPVVSGNKLTWNIPQLSVGESTVSFKIRAKSGTAVGTYTPCTGKITYTDYAQTTQTINLIAPDLLCIEDMGLTARGGDTIVNLQWKEVTGAEKYRISVYRNAVFQREIFVTGEEKTTVTNLINGVEYGFWVQAYVNGKYNNQPDPLNPVYATPMAPVQGDETPQNLVAVPGDKKVDLTWDQVVDAEKYRVCVFLDGKIQKYQFATGKENITVSALKNGVEYGFWVQSYKNGKYSKDPDTANLVLATPTAPAPKDETPQNLVAVAGDKKVDLTWDAVDGAEKYRVCVFQNGKLKKYLNVTGKETATVTSLTNGTEYGFWVQVYKNAKYSKDPDTANLVLATPTAPAPKDETPANLTATAGDKKVILTWDAVDGAEKYRVCVFQKGKLKKYINVTGKETATVTSLINGTEYGFWVQVYKNGKYSKDPDTANLVLATPKQAPVVDESPKNLTAVAGNKKVDLTWDAVVGAEKYRVCVFQNGKLKKYLNVANTQTSATVTSLINGTEYGFWVQVYKNGKYSPIPTDTTKLVKAVPYDNTPKPAAPTIDTVTAGNRSVVVKWNAVAGAEKYRVCVYKSGKLQKYVNVANTKTEATVTSLTNGTEYSFGVQSYSNGKYSEITDINALPTATPKAVVVVTPSPANIDVIEGNKSVTVTWDAVAGAEKYRICTYNSNGTIKKYNFTTTDTTYTVTSLVNGTEYGFWVQAYANGRYSDAPAAAQLCYATPHA